LARGWSALASCCCRESCAGDCECGREERGFDEENCHRICRRGSVVFYSQTHRERVGFGASPPRSRAVCCQRPFAPVNAI